MRLPRLALEGLLASSERFDQVPTAQGEWTGWPWQSENLARELLLLTTAEC